MYPNIPGFDNAKYFTSLISALYLLIKYTSVHYLPSPTTEKIQTNKQQNIHICTMEYCLLLLLVYIHVYIAKNID